MKTRRLTLFVLLVCSMVSLQAQLRYYRFPRRLPPQMPAQPYPQTLGPTNVPIQNTSTNPAPAPAPAPPVIVTQVVVRVVQPPPDPEKVKAQKAELLRRVVDFQKRRAEEGSESAQYELGLRYLKGDGVEKDEPAGRKWLALASKHGYLPATRKLEELDSFLTPRR